MRRTVGIVVAVCGAALSAFILGEYEMVGIVPVMAGVVVGLLLSEVVVGIARWWGPVAAVLVGTLAVASLILAGWIDSSQGVEPYPTMAGVGAAVAAVVAVARAWRRPRRQSRA
ncbi:MAG: hypothetical protein WD232_05930 [Acidimicrobiales bacterium]